MGRCVTLPAYLASFFGSSACTMCCPSYGYSITTRICYGVILLLGTITAALMLSPGLQNLLQNAPFCSNLPTDSLTLDCSALVGYSAVYRVSFALAMFFLLLATIMIGVRNKQDVRTGIQNGYWGFKIIFLFLLLVGAFYIPESGFGATWMVFGLIGGFIFIIVQQYLITRIVYDWALILLNHYVDNTSRIWYLILLISTLFFYSIGITSLAILLDSYTTHSGCTLNKFFIYFNGVLCIITNVISILPRLQKYRPASGLFQSSIVSCYIILLTWSALENSPDPTCHRNVNDPDSISHLNNDSIFALVLWLFVMMYTAFRTVSSSTKLSTSKSNLTDDVEASDESETVKYSWSLFHLILALASFYIMMTLTNWFSPQSTLITFSSNAASMWVKIIASWLCVLLYNLYNAAPMLMPEIDFENF